MSTDHELTSAVRAKLQPSKLTTKRAAALEALVVAWLDEHTEAARPGLHGLDVEAFLEWFREGLVVYDTATHDGPLPPLAEVRRRAEDVVLLIAWRRTKNTTHVAAALGTTRRAIRDRLAKHGITNPPLPRFHAPADQACGACGRPVGDRPRFNKAGLAFCSEWHRRQYARRVVAR